MDLELSATTVTVLVSVIIPIITGLLTKITTPPWVKSVVTIVLNAVNALVTTAVLADGTAVLSQGTLVTFIMGVVISVAAYAGVYKPANITSSTPDGKLAPNKGVL
jgi:hypothetical protein